MKPTPILRSLIFLSFLLSACAGVNQSAEQTDAADALAAELAAAQAESELQTAEAENASLQATNNALSTQNASGQAQPTATQGQVATSTPQASPTRTISAATQAATHEPGISARYESKKTCDGTPYALILVRNLGPETYQSAIVRISDEFGEELRRSDGNNEFLPSATCPGTEGPTLSPGEEKYVTVSAAGAASGALIKVTVCTEKGYGGNCWTSTTTYVE